MTEPIAIALIGLFGQLLWPIFLFFFLYRFQPEVIALLRRIASFKLAGNEFVFQPPASDAPPPSEITVAKQFSMDATGFLDLDSLGGVVRNSGFIDPSAKIGNDLLLFNSPTQRTWLLTAGGKVFVLLDDENTRRTSQILQTYFEKSNTLPITINIERGTIKFAAESTAWFYSLALFPSAADLKSRIAKLVSE